jgi:hypothetical protein
MEQKRKIIIPVGSASGEATAARNFDGAATARAPLFDEEATMGARPVVPLAKASNPPSRRFPLLALVVVLAVGAGVAGGFVIGLYKSRQSKERAAAPTATTTIGTDQTAQTPARQLPALASEKSSAPPARTVAAENTTAERTARDNGTKRDGDEVTAPVDVRERAREKRDREDRDREERIARADEEREIRKEQKKERRRRARENNETDAADVNQQIERGAREVNRIREIFEGQRP